MGKVAKSIVRHPWAVGLILAGIAAIAFVAGSLTLGQAQDASRGVLYLAAVADDRLADHGDREEASIVVTVNSEDGAQEGLLKGNFLVETQIGAVAVTVTRLGSTGHGVYLLDIVPRGTNTWYKGRYVLSVHVSCPVGSASTVTELVID
jgi:hypothetical protein